MKTLNFLEALETEAKQIIQSYLRPVRFPKGCRILCMGDSGDGCYIIDVGEVRLELVQMETDSEGILGYLGPGSLLGEFSLIDGQPRSASAFAHCDVTARWLSKSDFERVCATTFISLRWRQLLFGSDSGINSSSFSLFSRVILGG